MCPLPIAVHHPLSPPSTPRLAAELKRPRHNSTAAPYAAAGILLLLVKVDKAERSS
jgi:hypothetical protein